MLAEFLSRIWNAIPFVGTRKRNLSCRDCSDDDDDMELEVVVTNPKRARMDPTWPDTGFSFMQNPNEAKTHRATWINKSQRRFSQTFFVRNQQTALPSRCLPNCDEVITIEDDGDEPEVVVVSSDLSVGMAERPSKSDLLRRPPLSSQRSFPESVAKSKNGTQNAELSSVRKKMNVLNGSRQSESRNSSRRSTPIKQMNSSYRSRMFNTCRIHEFTDRENMPRSSRGSTAENSVRLAERECYADFLKIFSGNNTSRVPGSVFSLCTSKQVNASDSRKENIVTMRKSPVSRQKLGNSYSENLKGRLSSGFTNGKAVLKPVQEVQGEVTWLSSSPGSSGVKLIERKIYPSKATSSLKNSAAKKDIEVITLPSPEPESGSNDVMPWPKEVVSGSEEVIAVSEEVKVVPKELNKSYKLQDNPLLNSVYINDKWLSNVISSYKCKDEERQKLIESAAAEAKQIQDQWDAKLEEKMRNALRLQEIKLLDDEEEVQEIEKLVELTSEMLNKIKEALHPTPPNEVLVEAFNLRITRRDMETLSRDNWLNDEVINFYFTLLYERGKLDNYPSVHVCNTFFYPKLINNGHSSLKRWTRKIDIFAHDMMLVPVHLGVHWCLAVIDFRHKKIQYYDSMSGKNQQCLNALKGYLEAESLDKKKQKLDTSDWSLETVKDKPNQLNGSDCGMFTCKYAEYISRDAKITFTQEDMPYFRRRMVYEILTAKLL